MITGFIAAARGIDSKGEKVYATCDESNGALTIALTVFLIFQLLGGPRTPNLALLMLKRSSQR